MSENITKKHVLNALEQIYPNNSHTNVVAAGMISSVIVKQDNVGFAIEIDTDNISREEAETLRKECENAVTLINNVNKVTAVLTAENTGDVTTDTDKNRPAAMTKENTQPHSPKSLLGVKHIIAVGSGKGGVGKSTIAANIAVTLSQRGYATGLVDADILGPSLARIMGLEGKPEIANNQMVPLENHGVKCLSMGLLLDEETPMVWRGPMISKAIRQLFTGAMWGKLDYLIVDLPPGTGDIHLSITQNFAVDGALIVTTPQEVALMDVKKAIGMFEKLNVPILGIIENMSYFIDPESGNKTHIFGENTIANYTKSKKLSLLAEIPLIPEISTLSDQGTPITTTQDDGNITTLFSSIIDNVEDFFV